MGKSFWLLAYTGAFYIAFMMGVQTWTFVLMMWDPFYYHSIKVLTPVVHRCGVLTVELDVQRYRACKVDIDRFMVNVPTGDVIMRERVPGGATKLGRDVITNKFKIACDAPLGKTRLMQSVASQCIDGVHSMSWPIVEFEVVE